MKSHCHTPPLKSLYSCDPLLAAGAPPPDKSSLGEVVQLVVQAQQVSFSRGDCSMPQSALAQLWHCDGKRSCSHHGSWASQSPVMSAKLAGQSVHTRLISSYETDVVPFPPPPSLSPLAPATHHTPAASPEFAPSLVKAPHLSA